MEQVVELFKRYRSREIATKEFTSTLKTFLNNHPQAARQGLGWLDLAQQRQPMPVTEFIQLRADMDYMLRSLVLNSTEIDPTRIANTAPRTITSPANDEAQATVVQRPSRAASDNDGPTVIQRTAHDDDATHIAAPAFAQAAQEPAANEPTVVVRATATEEKTVISNARGAQPINEKTVIAAPRDAEATVVSTPSKAATSNTPVTQVGSAVTTAGSANDVASSDATKVAAPAARDGAPKLPHSQRIPPRTVAPGPTSTVPATKPKSASLVLGMVGGIAAAIVIVGAFAWWKSTQPHSLSSTKASTDRSSVEKSTTENATDSTSTTTTSIETPQTNSTDKQETVMLQLEVVSDAPSLSVATSDSSPVANIRPSVQPIPPKEAVEPLPDDVSGLFAIVKKRVDKGRLLPAHDPNSATFAIKALIAKAPDSDEVSEARKILSQAHLELARQAREKGDLEAAQTHLDNAFDVRLMK